MLPDAFKCNKLNCNFTVIFIMQLYSTLQLLKHLIQLCFIFLFHINYNKIIINYTINLDNYVALTLSYLTIICHIAYNTFVFLHFGKSKMYILGLSNWLKTKSNFILKYYQNSNYIRI